MIPCLFLVFLTGFALLAEFMRDKIGEIFDKEGVSLDAARHPRQIVYIYSDYPFEINDLLRLA